MNSEQTELTKPLKVTIIGSGNWGSAIALIIGENAAKYNDFETLVHMWVYEEMIGDEKLTDIINQQHENVKYLPGKKFPLNVVAEPDLVKSCTNSDILVFVIPHQFVANVCNELKGKLKKDALAISLIKGFMVQKKVGGIRLVSEEIHEILKIDTAVLMGANLASEVANHDFCEATIGCRGKEAHWPALKKLFESDHFRINVTEDANTVELCGGLKNIVGCAAGFADGLGFGSNTKAAVIRLGLMEITKFVELFYPGSSIRTFFESCGIGDLVATCAGGRNRQVCEAFVKTGKSIKQLEKELLNGQSAQGPMTAEEVYQMLKKYNMTSRFPLFVTVHQICQHQISPELLVSRLRECE